MSQPRSRFRSAQPMISQHANSTRRPRHQNTQRSIPNHRCGRASSGRGQSSEARPSHGAVLSISGYWHRSKPALPQRMAHLHPPYRSRDTEHSRPRSGSTEGRTSLLEKSSRPFAEISNRGHQAEVIGPKQSRFLQGQIQTAVKRLPRHPDRDGRLGQDVEDEDFGFLEQLLWMSDPVDEPRVRRLPERACSGRSRR